VKGEGALLVLAPKGKGKGGDMPPGPEPDGDEKDTDAELTAAGEDAMKALDAGDAASFAQAIAQICRMSVEY
jgi:hypothetical protein